MRLTRADRSVLSDWWFTVDRLMFFGLLLLMGAGLVLSLAASPPIAAKYHLEPFYFVRRQAAMLLPAIAIMFAASTLTPKQIRRASLVIFVVGIALMALILLVGPEIKGAKRWLRDRLLLDPAFRVRQARLRRAHRLAVQRGAEAARCARHPARRRALRRLRRARSSCSPISARRCSSRWSGARSFFMAGINLVWIGALGRCRRSAASSPPICSCRMSPRASTASSIPPPATPIRPTARSNPSCMAAGSGEVPARARSRTCSPTPTPTSSSRWPPRNMD